MGRTRARSRRIGMAAQRSAGLFPGMPGRSHSRSPSIAAYWGAPQAAAGGGGGGADDAEEVEEEEEEEEEWEEEEEEEEEGWQGGLQPDAMGLHALGLGGDANARLGSTSLGATVEGSQMSQHGKRGSFQAATSGGLVASGTGGGQGGEGRTAAVGARQQRFGAVSKAGNVDVFQAFGFTRAIQGAGALFGALSSSGIGNRGVTAVSLEPCSLLVFDDQTFQRCVSDTKTDGQVCIAPPLVHTPLTRHSHAAHTPLG